MVEIKAGPELDRAVAEAIGWTYRQSSSQWAEILGLVCWHDTDGNEHHGYPPAVSTDMNAAHEAAEKVGLFDRYALTRLGDVWRITPAKQGLWFADPVLASGPTPALAICAAILNLKEAE